MKLIHARHMNNAALPCHNKGVDNGHGFIFANMKLVTVAFIVCIRISIILQLQQVIVCNRMTNLDPVKLHSDKHRSESLFLTDNTP